ncbi:Rieske (2Fe-2S) protein [Streptomyces halobius]|uniref:Cytochrome bc1 complex Rieske iron-sulfur subunit n=1 Tax=Streptomyces halobius TaxID=2879846 RepID=A0ABY4MI04_9ACTN|nr:Rieske (2Fe-2S) protein [Streptomyces halobius]UQA96872.1 Rieske (2Fe-2S) protein [Streptomyces halobius]
MARQAPLERTGESDAATGAGGGTARRTVVAAVGAAGLTAALAACGGGAEVADGEQPAAAEAGGAGGTGGNGGDGGATGGTAGGRSGLAKTSEIPKGGGKIFKAEKVVVTQPQDGEFKAFSAICTHAGCVVGEVSGGTINCMCHGSRFDLTDGSVREGPATKGLPAAKVNVEGGSVMLG